MKKIIISIFTWTTKGKTVGDCKLRFAFVLFLIFALPVIISTLIRKYV